MPKPLRDRAILVADSTFLLTAGSTQGQKDPHGQWLFSDATASFGRPHHKYKYAVGHRAHTLMTVSGIPLVSHIATARDSDQDYLLPNIQAVRQRFPMLSIGAVIVDAGYDSDDHHDFLYTEYGIIAVIVKDTLAYPSGYSPDGSPLCPLGYPTRRKGIEYNHQRTKFACHKVCVQDPQKQLFTCPYATSHSKFGYTTYTYFRQGHRKFGPAVPGSRLYKYLKPMRTGIERYYGLAKENRYRMEQHNTYVGRDNLLIHVTEYDIVLTLDILFAFAQCGKQSDVLAF
jgi:hypothetical protein